MGVCASIFSLRTKTQLYFDRLYNAEVDDVTYDINFDETFSKLCDYKFDGIKVFEAKKYFSLLLEIKNNKIGLKEIIGYLNLLEDDDNVFIVADNDENEESFELYSHFDNIENTFYTYDDNGDIIELNTHRVFNNKIVTLGEYRDQRIDEILEDENDMY